jgi:hypothetical protein
MTVLLAAMSNDHFEWGRIEEYIITWEPSKALVLFDWSFLASARDLCIIS